MTRKIKFGIELEYTNPSNVSMQSLVNKLRLKNIDILVKPYGHSSEDVGTSDWKLTCDGSITGNGIELVSRPFTDLSLCINQLRIILKTFKAHDMSIDKSCGMHVHHDIALHGLSNSDIMRMVTYYSQCDKLILPLVAKSRETNGFCKPYRDNDSRQNDKMDYEIIQWYGEQLELNQLPGNSSLRYKHVNLCAKQRYNTIEFRQKESTYDIDDIVRWIEFTQAMMVYAKSFKVYNTFSRAEYTMSEVESMFKKLSLDVNSYADCYA